MDKKPNEDFTLIGIAICHITLQSGLTRTLFTSPNNSIRSIFIDEHFRHEFIPNLSLLIKRLPSKENLPVSRSTIPKTKIKPQTILSYYECKNPRKVIGPEIHIHAISYEHSETLLDQTSSTVIPIKQISNKVEYGGFPSRKNLLLVGNILKILVPLGTYNLSPKGVSFISKFVNLLHNLGICAYTHCFAHS